MKTKFNKFEEINKLFNEWNRIYSLWEKTGLNLDNINFVKNAPIGIQQKELEKWNDTLNSLLLIENKIQKLLDNK